MSELLFSTAYESKFVEKLLVGLACALAHKPVLGLFLFIFPFNCIIYIYLALLLRVVCTLAHKHPLGFFCLLCYLDLSFTYDLLRPSAGSCLCTGAQSFLSVFIHFSTLVLIFSLGFISFSLVCTSSALLLDSACAPAYNHYLCIFPFIFSLLLSMLLSLFCHAQPSMRTSSIYILWFIH